MIYIVKAEWNASVTDLLSQAAADYLESQKREFKLIKVPGALEIPLAFLWAYQEKPEDFEGGIACGCVIEGDTYHFEVVANESARGLQEVSLQIARPLTNAILTVYTTEQALERTQASANKGREAAESLVQMLKLRPPHFAKSQL